MVVASLAIPIARSFMSSLDRLLEQCLLLWIQLKWWFIKSFGWSFNSRFRFLSVNLKALDLHCLSFLLKFEWWFFLSSRHMNWLSSGVLDCLEFFASIAFFSALKVIVLTFRALPTTLWEFELSLRFLKMTLFGSFVWSITWRTLCFWRCRSRIGLSINVNYFITIILLNRSSLIDLKIDPSHIFLQLE